VLSELRVEGLGIVDELTVVLGRGMTVVTGETGAGKTLLVEAVELLVGGRADGGLVRAGVDEARVEGRFVDAETDAEVVVARVVPGSGRSRAYVNGRLATAAELAQIGARFVDLHGQHEHQSLLAPATQRRALDELAGDAAADALRAYRDARAERRRIDDALGALGGDARARAHELDLLRFQLEEIESAALDDPDEAVALEAEEDLLADAVAHQDALAFALDALDDVVLDAVGTAYARLVDRRPFTALAERLHALQGDAADVASELRVAREGIVVDPDRLAIVGERRRLLRELTRKYGDTLADVVRFGEEAARRIEELSGFDARAAELEAARAAADDAAAGAAARLSAARRAAAPRFAAAVTEHLRELAMPAAALTVDVSPATPGDDGADDVTFLLAPNPGEPARPLARAASGGELARAMLAVRVVLAGARAAGDEMTLVFDEVDAGIGGQAGVAVGRALSLLAHEQQVLCVTHLAQVAAFAEHQVVVAKSTVDGRTVASAEAVDGAARVAELSRMLAGSDASRHARGHAEELIDDARRQRDEARAGRRG
jgi:DNA repair protein RecN (Recombination protein N)